MRPLSFSTGRMSGKVGSNGRVFQLLGECLVLTHRCPFHRSLPCRSHYTKPCTQLHELPLMPFHSERHLCSGHTGKIFPEAQTRHRHPTTCPIQTQRNIQVYIFERTSQRIRRSGVATASSNDSIQDSQSPRYPTGRRLTNYYECSVLYV